MTKYDTKTTILKGEHFYDNDYGQGFSKSDLTDLLPIKPDPEAPDLMYLRRTKDGDWIITVTFIPEKDDQ